MIRTARNTPALNKFLKLDGTTPIPKSAGQNSEAILWYVAGGDRNRGATSFLVQHRDDGTSLMATNQHVVEYGDPSKSYIELADGSRVTVKERIAVSKKYDFGLIRVKQTESLARIKPLRFSTAHKDDVLYSFAYTNLRKLQRDTGSSSNDKFDQIFENANAPLMRKNQPSKTLQMGVRGESVEGKVTITTTMPGYNGSSGSPVFSTENDGLIGVVRAGHPRLAQRKATGDQEAHWKTNYVPISLLRNYLKRLVLSNVPNKKIIEELLDFQSSNAS